MKKIYKTAYASLRIFGENIDPLLVTKDLMIPPDSQKRKGEPRLSRTAKGRIMEYAPYSTNMWSFSSEEWVNSPNLSTHLIWILNEIEHKKQLLQKYTNDSTLNVDVFCYSICNSEIPPSFPNEIKKRFNELGINIQIDHYTVDH